MAANRCINLLLEKFVVFLTMKNKVIVVERIRCSLRFQ